MKESDAVNQILLSISKDSSIPVDKLHLIGITQEQIAKAVKDCRKHGSSIKESIRIILKIWEKSDPTQKSPTIDEMKLLGFTNNADTWSHDKAGIIVTEQQRQTLSQSIITNELFNDEKALNYSIEHVYLLLIRQYESHENT